MSAASAPNISELLSLDPHISHFRSHLDALYSNYQGTRAHILSVSPSLDQFARSYREYGIQLQSDKSVRCREWAPNLSRLSLAGDFNDWNRTEYQLEPVGEGVWELVIQPDEEGECRIHAGSDLRYFCEDNQGKKFDRISPWARYVTQGERVYYNEVFQHSVKFEWNYKAPEPPRVLYIYESHVGICTPEPKISSYIEFADTVIPRIAKLGYNTIQLMAVMEHAYYASFGYQVSSSSYSVYSVLQLLVYF